MKLLASLGFVLLIAALQADAAEKCQSEVVVTLDLSDTITIEELKQVKNFVKNVGKELSKNKDNRVGVASFAETAKSEAECSTGTIRYDQFSSQVNAIQKYGEFTNIEAGLLKAEAMLDRAGCSLSRPGRHIILLVSDGNGNYGYESSLMREAERIRNKGIKIFSLGIQNQHYREGVLTRISGHAEYVKPVAGFESLKDIDFRQIIDKISCFANVVKPTAKITTTTPKPTTTTTKEPTTTTDYYTTTTEEPTTTTGLHNNHRTSHRHQKNTTTEEPTTTTEYYTTTTEEPTTTTEEITTTTEEPTTTDYYTTTTEPITTTEEITTTTTKKPMPVPKTCDCVIPKDFMPCLTWTKADILTNFEGDCVVDKFKKALEYINHRAMAIVGKLLAFRQCQKHIQDHIITTSIKQFGSGLPSSPIIDKSSVLQRLFLKESQCEFNIRGRLMQWKLQLMTVRQMIEHEILFQQNGFFSAFDCK
uniref:VWFA domain-containing protein n=2 Tax=Clytia hemisphaerica TaxID=252671 RepID=A0A7M5XM36_9CNID